MREVHREDFFHYQSNPKPYWGGVGVTPWQVGQTHVIGKSFNPYFDFYNQFWGQQPGVTNGQNVLGMMKQGGIASVIQAVPFVEKIVQDLFKQSDLVKELVFEDVRSESFPGYPSRQRCIWVMPATFEGARY